MDEYAKEFDRKNIIFIRDSIRKLGYIPFKFDLTKEYIKQFLLIFSPPDFNKFVHERIKDKIKTVPTSRVIGARDKYLRDWNSLGAFTYLETLYVPHCFPAIYIASDLCLKANK